MGIENRPMDPNAAAAFMEAVAKAAKERKAPDTSATPPNRTEKDIDESINHRQKSVRQRFIESTSYATNSGWRSVTEWMGSDFVITGWHSQRGDPPKDANDTLSEDRMPQRLVNRVASEELRRVMDENQRLKAVIEAKNQEIARLKSDQDVAGGSGGPNSQGMERVV